MSGLPTTALVTRAASPRAVRSYIEFRSGIDQRVLRVFASKALRRSLRDGGKVNLEVLWGHTAKALAAPQGRVDQPALKPSDIHRAIMQGLPGEALYVSSAMAFDSMGRRRPGVKLYRARAWRGGPVQFDPLDAAASVAGPKGWRFNDLSTEILYTAEVEALAILEVAVRPGWETIQQVLVATIEIPDGAVVSLEDLGIVLPRNWNARPVADDSRVVAREFLSAVGRMPAGSARPAGLRVPSVRMRALRG